MITVILGTLELWLHLITSSVSYAAKAGKFRYIRNITDIDDKIIARANENGESIQQLTARFIDAMNEDAANLGCAAPDEAPKATEYI